jgi:hypothetical protein
MTKIAHVRAFRVADMIFIRVLLTDKGSDCGASSAASHRVVGGNAMIVDNEG